MNPDYIIWYVLFAPSQIGRPAQVERETASEKNWRRSKRRKRKWGRGRSRSVAMSSLSSLSSSSPSSRPPFHTPSAPCQLFSRPAYRESHWDMSLLKHLQDAPASSYGQRTLISSSIDSSVMSHQTCSLYRTELGLMVVSLVTPP